MAAFAAAAFASFARSLAGPDPVPDTKANTPTMPTMMRAISPRNTPRTRFMRNLRISTQRAVAFGGTPPLLRSWCVRSGRWVGSAVSSLAIKGTRERGASQNDPSIFNPR